MVKVSLVQIVNTLCQPIVEDRFIDPATYVLRPGYLAGNPVPVDAHPWEDLTHAVRKFGRNVVDPVKGTRSAPSTSTCESQCWLRCPSGLDST